MKTLELRAKAATATNSTPTGLGGPTKTLTSKPKPKAAAAASSTPSGLGGPKKTLESKSFATTIASSTPSSLGGPTKTPTSKPKPKAAAAASSTPSSLGGPTKTPDSKPNERKVNPPPTSVNSPQPPEVNPTPSPKLTALQNYHDAFHKAKHGLIEGFVPIQMSLAFPFNGTSDKDIFRAYLDKILLEAGNPSDLMQRMLIEQFAFFHLRLADLQVKAALAESIEAQKILNNLCLRIFGELLRMKQIFNQQRPKVAERPIDPTANAS